MKNLCKCNNCDTILIDHNPQTNAIKLPVSGKEQELKLMDNDDGRYWVCPNCKTDSFLVDFEDAVLYISDHKESFWWKDFMDAAKNNVIYAKLLLDRVSWQSPYTLAEEDIMGGEIIEFCDQYFLTNGKPYLSGDEAKNFWFNMNTQTSLTGRWEDNDYPKIGGYFPNANQWIAFDNTKGNASVDVFSDEKEAIKYAQGIIATTISGEQF